MKLSLTTAHQLTYDTIFGHPVAPNLAWRDVRSLLENLGHVAVQPNGHLRVTCNGQSMVLHPAQDHSITSLDEQKLLRHFLAKVTNETAAPPTSGTHLLVVIDHREARVYQTELHGSVPQCITPFDPHGFGRQLHYVQDDSNGKRKPERKSFYDAVVKTLTGAGSILIFGSGTGTSSAMVHLVEELRTHHHELAQHIVGEVILDQQHLSENQLLAVARSFYANRVEADSTPAL
jgi:hypothetical protein